MNLNKIYIIEGPLHPVQVRFTTKKVLAQEFQEKGTTEVYGLWDQNKNMISIAKDQTEIERLHTFLHELTHMIISQTREHDEEAICDILGSYFRRFFKVNSLEEVLK